MANQAQRLAELQKRDRHLRFRTDPQLKVVRHLRGNLEKVDGKRLREKAMAFVRSNTELFGDVGQEMQVLAESTDANGGSDVIFQQFHAGARVHGGSIRLHVREDGVLDTVSNSLFPDLARVPKKPRITAQTAVKNAQRSTKTTSQPKKEPELIVYRHENKPRLVWRIELDDPKAGDRGRPAQWIVLVDATTGAIVLQYDNIKTVGPVSAPGVGYYSGAGMVNAFDNGATFQLRDTTRTGVGGPEIITNDEDGASPSEDPDSNWNDMTIVPRHAHQGPEVDAHRYAGEVIDYFQTMFGRNSYNGAAANVNVLVHVGTNTSNGWWDGSRVNLGDGTGVAATGDDYECSDDWLAHELTHAYTQFTCDLTYWAESGALNEAFSDIFAAFITGDWLVFEDTWLKASAPAWRNMIDPTNGGQWNNSSEAAVQTSIFAGHQPSHYTTRYTGMWDNAGVHINSGIINHLFYLLTVGGTHAISGVTVTGIGQAAAESMLWDCMSVKLIGKVDASFLDFREAMLDSCLDLFPTDLQKLTQVKNAFNAVGIGPDIYVRDTLSDTGTEPSTMGFSSPDIIIRQTQSLTPATDFADLTNGSFSQNIEKGQTNFAYIRLQNRGPQSGDATVTLYLIPMTSFANPAGWITVGTSAPVIGLAPGGLSIVEIPIPDAVIPAPDHYCAIAVVTSSLDPAPDHTLIASVTDYLFFVANTNNIAYRNLEVVNLVAGLPGVLEMTVQTIASQAKYDLQFVADKLPEGIKVRIKAPAKAVRGARLRGLKLVARGREDVYELLAGKPLRRQLEFLGAAAVDRTIGLDGVLVDKPFRLRIEYELPENVPLEQTVRDGAGTFSVRQLFEGKVMGAAGVQFNVQKPKRGIVDRDAGKARLPVRRKK